MKQLNLKELTVEQLVERFTAIALAQDDALLDNDTAKFTRLYWQMDSVNGELKSRANDQRKSLLPLLNHPNAQVRLKAAIATLAVEPEVARNALQRIVDRSEFPQTAYARGMMRALDEGTYKPS